MTFCEPSYISNWEYQPLKHRGYSSFHGLDEVVSEVIAEISAGFGRTQIARRNREAATVAIIASIHQCVMEGRPLGVHLNRNHYHRKPQLHPAWWGYRSISGVIALLEEFDFIHAWKGYALEDGRGFITKVYASNRLLKLFETHAPVAFETESYQTLVLRNGFKEAITYTGNAFTEKVQQEIDAYNNWMRGHVVMIGDRRLGTEYTAIYSRSQWDKHGRWYNDQVQNLPSAMRAQITINGEPVVEPDFTSMHPRLGYAREGIPPVQIDGDYYRPVMDHLGVLGADIRRAVKQMMSIMFNAEDELKACGAFQDRINKAKRGRHTEKKGKILRMEQAMEICGIDQDDLIDAIMEVHSPIAHYFCSDAGVDLMFDDSNIMRGILEQLMARNIPALPVHDSVIVPKRFEEEVEAIMEQAFIGYTCNPRTRIGR